MSLRQRAYVALFALGAGVFALALGAGVVARLARDGALPGLGINYVRHLRDLERRGDVAQVVEQWRVAAALDGSRRHETLNNLGNFLRQRGEPEAAVAAYREALDAEPRHAGAHSNLATALAELGRFEEALAHLHEALRLQPGLRTARSNLATVRELQRDALRRALHADPNATALQNNLAWFLATQPDAALREPAEAIRLAEVATATTARRNPATLDTLAAAYAAAGRFGDAVGAAGAALELANAAGDGELAAQIEQRLALYRRREPYRDPSL